ncbi:hypothetical protein AA103196_1180 [Ameyamaea chiangmaiensis NBRC 103196]|uniref:Glycosyltransferase family 2 protein n=1 Tax=Ameyamaea chiangmaiensis TaxID=442969 RepID=A0A850PF96_9PROT|nr:glycosyltransferase family 2 protein [Ameyamaea chiangmaiensis]MBS4075052.1 glycosyltransferase family 2 protein [Ameyamaea chiangmaiensis]NVN41130.1 glycosyltransferase family 2 protein [Ameyamaea chiangmaiensis]GBQ65637.1 hypothetical protein AA103196_1180 [Ameyamaea chiangmaiensis NBRC 103196]
MTKSALTLFVKDEFDDISWWMSYHLALGADTLIIFDDHSTDGTWELINAAARHFDVRPHRTNTAEDNFYLRQRESYLTSLSLYGSEFDWMASLDGDEYVNIKSHDSLNAFLDEFPDADGIALSWRCFGSNQNAFKPRHSPLRAYLHASDETLSDNDLIKSFIRPRAFGGHYIDPHRWDVDNDRYVDADGKRVEWKGSGMNPNWGRAQINHYICRSMEHYLKRLQNRPDIHKTTIFWDHFNVNKVFDDSILKHEHQTKILNYSIWQSLWETRGASQHSVYRPVVFGEPVFELSTQTGLHVCMDKSRNIVVAVDPDAVDGNDLARILCVKSPSEDNVVFIFQEGARDSSPVFVSEAALSLPYIPMKFEYFPDEGNFAFSSFAGIFLCANPHDGSVLLNRYNPGEWERFHLRPVHGEFLKDVCALSWLVYEGRNMKTHDDIIQSARRIPAADVYVIASFFHMLPSSEKYLARQKMTGWFPAWLS